MDGFVCILTIHISLCSQTNFLILLKSFHEIPEMQRGCEPVCVSILDYLLPIIATKIYCIELRELP